jgi:thiazole synthase ThiGH ThiG subunit
MARAFALAVEAGRAAFHAGVIEEGVEAVASSSPAGAVHGS